MPWRVHYLFICGVALLSTGFGGTIMYSACVWETRLISLLCHGGVVAVLQMEASPAAGLGGFELLFSDMADGVKGAGTAVAAGVLGVQAWLSSGMQLLIKVSLVLLAAPCSRGPPA
jgi:hypothetical protein